MDNNVITSLDALEEMIKDVSSTARCAIGTCGGCGCGMIHEIFYMCKCHNNRLKSNTHLSMN